MTSPEERERRSKRLKRNRIARELRENRAFLPKIEKGKIPIKKFTLKDLDKNGWIDDTDDNI